jgi:intracellular septation protein
MKFLFDLFPVLLFFVMFKWGEGHVDAAQSLAAQTMSGLVSGGIVTAAQAPILLATAVAIVASFAQIGYLLLRKRKVDGMLWVSLGIIGLLGTATIYFHNDTFIKWKPTVLYWVFAMSLCVSQVLFKKNLIRSAMEEQIHLPDPVWQRLGLAWTIFFFSMGFINLFVAFVLFKSNTAAWVNFKLFGGVGLFFAFVVGQSVYLSKYVEDSA